MAVKVIILSTFGCKGRYFGDFWASKAINFVIFVSESLNFKRPAKKQIFGKCDPPLNKSKVSHISTDLWGSKRYVVQNMGLY